MSTLAYALLTTKRDQAVPKTSETQSPGVKTFVDALAALIPAEVLVAHALIIPMSTTTTKDAQGQVVTTITDEFTLHWVFGALIVVSVLLYVLGRLRNLDRWDFLRVLIPPLAFVGWTMLQKMTAFDAVAPDFGTASRFSVAIIGAI